jgi:hypothetical protein
MKDHARAFVLVVGLGLPATVYADADSDFRTFASSKYTYCDAKLLASLWKQSVSDAKATMGKKLGRKDGVPVIDRALGDARKNAFKAKLRCDYDEAGFSYDDAEKLAKIWKKSVTDAKTLIEDKVMAGGTVALRELLKKSGGAAGGDDDDDISVFLKQDKFTYCDAKVISALWKKSVDEGKAYIGAKLRTKNPGALKSTLAQARNNARKNPSARCTFHDAFTFQDAQKLAKLWSLSVGEVKARVEEKLLAGNELYVRQQLETGGADDDDMAVFLRQSKYTYCDAKIIASLWKQSVERSKAYIGAKLATKNAAAVDNVLASARANAKKNRGARCSFHEAGYSFDDAVALGKIWKISESDTKVRVEDKILAGNEALVRKLLKR